jgi:hypothetical protein
MADGAAAREMKDEKPYGKADDRIEWVKERYDELSASTERTNFNSHWQEIGELETSRKIDFVGVRTAGEKRLFKIYDPTGIQCVELLAAGLHGMATNPASKWFSLRLVGVKAQGPEGEMIDANEIPVVQKYLADVEDIMWQRLYQPGTNFTTALHEVYLDLSSFGTAIMFLGQRDDGGLLFEARALSECVVAENHEGRIDTVFRKFKYTVRQLASLARSQGWKLSEATMEKIRSKHLNDEVLVIHAVFPREDYDTTLKRPSAKQMPFASIYFEHDACHALHESGFPEFPFMVPRWSKYSGETYGRGPGMTALADVKMLQAMMLTVIKTAQKIADPPMALRDNGVVGQARTIPGGITYFRGNPNEAFAQMPVAGNGLPITLELLEQQRNRIRATFYIDQLQFAGDANMTATEVMQRTQERMRLLGPLEGRLQSELLGPLIDRMFGILNRMKLLPPAPQEIQGQEFTVEYVSPLATAQKQIAANSLMQAMGVVAGVVGPEGAMMLAQKKINLEKVVDWAWDLFNCDPDLLNDDESMEAGRQKQQMMESLQMGQPAMDMVSKGAGALADVSKANGPQGGMDIGKFMSSLKEQIAADPRAQAELASLSQGEMPEPVA